MAEKASVRVKLWPEIFSVWKFLKNFQSKNSYLFRKIFRKMTLKLAVVLRQFEPKEAPREIKTELAEILKNKFLKFQQARPFCFLEAANFQLFQLVAELRSRG